MIRWSPSWSSSAEPSPSLQPQLWLPTHQVDWPLVMCADSCDHSSHLSVAKLIAPEFPWRKESVHWCLTLRLIQVQARQMQSVVCSAQVWTRNCLSTTSETALSQEVHWVEFHSLGLKNSLITVLQQSDTSNELQTHKQIYNEVMMTHIYPYTIQKYGSKE